MPSILSYAHSERGRAIRRRLHLLTVLGPLYGRHLVRRPFARTLRYVPGYRRASGLSNRHRQALYDSVLECLLRAYFRELRARYSPTTGPMLTLLIDVMKHLDMYLDAAETGGQIRAVAEILDVDGIRGPYEAFKEFAATHGQSEPVIRYLRNGFESHFPTYLGNMNRATRTGDPAAILDMAKDDSGFELRALMEMAALYNSTEPSDQAGRQVYAVGMVGKLADDMVDLKRDVRDGGINLLVTYVHQDRDEAASLASALAAGERLNIKWWRTNCPNAFAGFTHVLETYFEQITAPSMMDVADLLLVPAAMGMDYDSRRKG